MTSKLPPERHTATPAQRTENGRVALAAMGRSSDAAFPPGPARSAWQAYLERPDTRELIARQFCQNLGLTFPSVSVARAPEA